MLEIHGLYKEQKKNVINHISLTVERGQIISIECSNDMSEMLFNLIIGKEVTAKGEITLDGLKHSDYLKKHMGSVGVVFRDEGFYERMTILDYMRLFNGISHATADCQEVLLKLALLDLADVRIRDLDYSQRKRLSLAREVLKSPRLLLIQEPIINMNFEDARVIAENIEALRAKGTAILSTSVSFKDTLLLGGQVYHLDYNGLTNVQTTKADDYEVAAGPAEHSRPSYAIAKIPAKLEDRILLF